MQHFQRESLLFQEWSVIVGNTSIILMQVLGLHILDSPFLPCLSDVKILLKHSAILFSCNKKISKFTLNLINLSFLMTLVSTECGIRPLRWHSKNQYHDQISHIKRRLKIIYIQLDLGNICYSPRHIRRMCCSRQKHLNGIRCELIQFLFEWCGR